MKRFVDSTGKVSFGEGPIEIRLGKRSADKVEEVTELSEDETEAFLDKPSDFNLDSHTKRLKLKKGVKLEKRKRNRKDNI